MRDGRETSLMMNASGFSGMIDRSVIPVILLLTLFLSIFPRSGLGNTVSPIQSGKWSLIFDDEFNGTALDTTRWTTCYAGFKVGTNGCDHDGGELELYQPDEVTVHNGVLTLRAERKTVYADNGKTYNYTSGMISTGPSNDGEPVHFSFI